MEYYFLDSITWSFVSSSYFGARYSDYGAVFDVGGSSVSLSAPIPGESVGIGRYFFSVSVDTWCTKKMEILNRNDIF